MHSVLRTGRLVVLLLQQLVQYSTYIRARTMIHRASYSASRVGSRLNITVRPRIEGFVIREGIRRSFLLAMQSTFIPNDHFVDQLISSRYPAFMSWQRCRRTRSRHLHDGHRRYL